jgi:hypothetical protein
VDTDLESVGRDRTSRARQFSLLKAMLAKETGAAIVREIGKHRHDTSARVQNLRTMRFGLLATVQSVPGYA